jgi:hypothetical protein
VEFCKLLLRYKEVLLVPDASNILPWQLARKKRNFALLSLFLSTKYSLAEPQLAFHGQKAGVVGSNLMWEAISASSSYFVESLLAEKEALGIELPYHLKHTVRSAVEFVFQKAVDKLENLKYSEVEILGNLKPPAVDILEILKHSTHNKSEFETKTHFLDGIISKHRKLRQETIVDFEKEALKAAGFAGVLLSSSSPRDDIICFIQGLQYYKWEILPVWPAVPASRAWSTT